MKNVKPWTPYADLVVKNGKIYTVALTIDEIKAGKYDFPILEGGSVAVKDRKIIAVCPRGEDGAYIGPDTKVVDVGGRTVIPGIVDSHTHAMWTGTNLMSVDLSGCKCKQDMLDALAAKAKTVKPGEWVQGLKWNQLSWTDKEMPTRRELDRVCPDNPCYCVRLCYHIAVCNTRALELAGICEDTPNPNGGVYDRDASGALTGILHETGAMTPVASRIPEFTTEQYVRVIELMGREFNKNGITSIIDANLAPEQMRSYNEAKKQGKLHYRANLMYFLDDARGTIPEHLKRLEELVVTGGFGDEMLKLNAIKILLDGIPAVGTAYFREPYKHMPETRGFTTITPEELKLVARKAQEYDWQLACHTVGNAAADVALDAFEAASQISDVRPNRHYLIHHPWPCADQLPRMRELNVGVPVQTTIFHFMGECAILREDQARDGYSCKTYFDNGITVGGSSDSPIGSYDPFLSMYVACTREDSDGVVWGPEHAITPTQALIMYTKNSAFFSHDDDVLGSIEVGNWGDLAVLDRDFIAGDIHDIKNTRVDMTFLGGELVYERADA